MYRAQYSPYCLRVTEFWLGIVYLRAPRLLELTGPKEMLRIGLNGKDNMGTRNYARFRF